MSKYLWCEDSKSGYQFWCAIFRECFSDITVESKGSNTVLRKAVKNVNSDGNQYYVLMDMAMDNPDVLREAKKLQEVADGKDNVHVISLHSFEASLLSFELLEQWVFAEVDELKVRRQNWLDARVSLNKLLFSGGAAEDLVPIRNMLGVNEKKNTEQLAAKLLYEITRNTGFETDKSEVGPCFINNCCVWTARASDDICGLDHHRISAGEKARILVERSVLKRAFEGM